MSDNTKFSRAKAVASAQGIVRHNNECKCRDADILNASAHVLTLSERLEEALRVIKQQALVLCGQNMSKQSLIDALQSSTDFLARMKDEE